MLDIFTILAMLFSLWPIYLIIALVIYFRRRKSRDISHVETIKPRLIIDSSFNAHIGGTGALIITVLVITLIAIAQRILYDIARYIAPQNIDYFYNLQIIVAHAMFIIPLLIIAIISIIGLGQKREKYAIVLVPYFFTSLILTLQLITQITYYFYNHHTKLQYYLVMPLIIVILTAAIYYIQKLYQKKLEEMRLGSDPNV